MSKGYTDIGGWKRNALKSCEQNPTKFHNNYQSQTVLNILHLSMLKAALVTFPT